MCYAIYGIFSLGLSYLNQNKWLTFSSILVSIIFQHNNKSTRSTNGWEIVFKFKSKQNSLKESSGTGWSQSHGKLMYTGTNNGHSCAQDDTNNCAICLSQVEHGACTRLPCGHAFHSHCITQWEGHRRNPTLTLAVTCPLCRKPYTPSFGGVINHVAVARNLIHDFDMSTFTPYVQRALTSNTRQVGGLISTWR